MACVAVLSLVRTLELEFLQPHPRPIVQKNGFIISVNKWLIESLREKLEDLMEQLDEKRMHGVEAIKHLETKLRDVAFRVEDEIELQVVLLYVEKPQRGTMVKDTQPSRRLRHTLQQAMKDIHDIEEEWVKVKNEYTSLGLQGVQEPDQFIMVGTSSLEHASHCNDLMVGKNDEFEAIKAMLTVRPSQQREVVSITGMGGIGKTTLAKRVYEDPEVCSHFNKQAWVVASQHHSTRQMLVDILKSFSQQDSAESDRDDELKQRLYQCLKRCGRYLVVIDDLWSTEAWDAINACFPDDTNGSRVLLTTRLAEVANHVKSNDDFCHQVQLLNQCESWSLFCEKACRSDVVDFERVGRPIVEKCKRLPLAIVVVAGIFSKVTLSEWENIAVALNLFETTNIAEACSRIFSMSYNHLPYNLRACFLHLGVFPEDEEIDTKSLARLWAAEGLVKTFENGDFEVEAQRNIQELVDRNLILVSKLSSNGRKIKTFLIHDMLHAFCVREAQNENLLFVGENGFNFHHRGFRWVSIQSTYFDGLAFCSYSKYSRSIFRFKSTPVFLNLQNLDLLRVLYSSDEKIWGQYKLCRIKHRPIHLRYLSSSIVGTSFSSPYLSSSIVENCHLNPFYTWNLQTLCDGTYPPYSLDFPQMCHYYRNNSYTLLDSPNFVHQNLQTFSGLQLSSCTKKLFANTPSVKKVGISKTGESILDCISCIGNLVYLQQLESLNICVGFVMFGYPINNQIALLKNLKKLSFSGTQFQWEEINILGMLPRLEVLKLRKNSCRDGTWRLREEENFCQLICLKLDDVLLLHWEVSGVHFPNLERLFINQCSLEEIPSRFADITKLKSIELMRCCPSAVTSAKQIQEEQHEYGNHNFVVIEKQTFHDSDDSVEEEVELNAHSEEVEMELNAHSEEVEMELNADPEEEEVELNADDQSFDDFDDDLFFFLQFYYPNFRPPYPPTTR